MQINTKLSPGDTAWILLGNKARVSKVLSIRITVESIAQADISYSLARPSDIGKSRDDPEFLLLAEDRVFASKAELLGSL
jgi:hypothetical protein